MVHARGREPLIIIILAIAVAVAVVGHSLIGKECSHLASSHVSGAEKESANQLSEQVLVHVCNMRLPLPPSPPPIICLHPCMGWFFPSAVKARAPHLIWIDEAVLPGNHPRRGHALSHDQGEQRRLRGV